MLCPKLHCFVCAHFGKMRRHSIHTRGEFSNSIVSGNVKCSQWLSSHFGIILVFDGILCRRRAVFLCRRHGFLSIFNHLPRLIKQTNPFINLRNVLENLYGKDDIKKFAQDKWYKWKMLKLSNVFFSISRLFFEIVCNMRLPNVDGLPICWCFDFSLHLHFIDTTIFPTFNS